MSKLRITRGRFLSLLLSLGALALIAPFGRLFDWVGPRHWPASWVVGFFRHPNNAKVVGLAYLQQLPEERDPNVLLDRIFEGVTDRRSVLTAAGTGRRRAILLEQTRDDFAMGRTVKIDGWILSLTEARLCALVALTDRAEYGGLGSGRILREPFLIKHNGIMRN
jgi:hypothetical protein